MILTFFYFYLKLALIIYRLRNVCACTILRYHFYPSIHGECSIFSQNVDDGDYAVQCGNLFKFLYKLSVDSLHPEFTFQRKKTSIDILGALLNTFFIQRKDFPYAQVISELGMRKIYAMANDPSSLYHFISTSRLGQNDFIKNHSEEAIMKSVKAYST